MKNYSENISRSSKVFTVSSVVQTQDEKNLNIQIPVASSSNVAAATFEDAISATGYGTFNYILLLVGIPCCFSSIFSTTTMSYILPSAECDLQLSLLDKGTLNAITYAGMISSAVIWGYLSDTLGRKKLMVYGYLFDSLVVFLCALSQNVWSLMFFKFLSGFIVCGPFAVLMSYLTEFHGSKHRPRVMMATGMIFSSASICLPLIAWAIIPQPWSFIISDLLVIQSWQIFLAICCLPSLIAGITISFMPESPKFLMSQGKNDKALKVFRQIFEINTKRNKMEYPINLLIDEKSNATLNEKPKSNKKSLNSLSTVQTALLQITPLFKKPLLKKSVLVFTIQFCTLLGLNTMRLWLPELFTMVSENENDSNLCNMIMSSVNKSALNLEAMEKNDTCEDVIVGSSVYMNTIFVGLVGLFGYFIASAITNACCPKYILIFGLIIAGSFGVGLYWAENMLITFILSSMYVCVGSICSTALLSMVVNLFPTTLRTMTVSLLMMFGRTGSLIGNIIFPYLLSFGCFPPFLMLGLILIVCSLLCILLPKTTNKPLQ